MAHKHHRHSHQHHEKHRDEQAEGRKHSEQNDADFGTEEAATQNPYTTWSAPVMDPSGHFVYQTMARPDGGFWYHIEGPQSLHGSLVTGSTQPLSPEPYQGAGVASTMSSLYNTLLGEIAENQLLKAQIRAAETSQIANEGYYNDINTTTLGPSGRAEGEEIIGIEENPDIETGSKVRLPKRAGKQHATRRSSSRRHNEPRSHQSRHKEDERLAIKSAQSRRKVSEWFTRNENSSDY